ncbi:Partner of Y14 and mago [Abortiporus biennis]
MSKPDLFPKTSTAGIAVDPRTLERVIPESRRPDGSVRKQIKIRPGFTPQEDVKRFRGTKQAQMDANQLPKGHVVGWVPPSTTSTSSSSTAKTKSQKKNEKRKEKRKEKAVEEKVKDNWEDEDEDEVPPEKTTTDTKASPEAKEQVASKETELEEKMGKLNVK